VKDRIKLGFIGLGSRNTVYARNILKQFKDKIEVSAICDVDERKLKAFQGLLGHARAVAYTDFRKLLKEYDTTDGYLIAPPNHLHEELAIPFLQKNKTILLEKPLSHTHDSCMRIADAYNRSSSRVTLGFVLRYTPFYRTVKELVQDGEIGEVKNLNADEVVGPVLSSVFFRTWRGKRKYTGDLLLEKCCHDLDLIGDILKVAPVRVSAFAADNHYTAREGYGPRCRECAYHDTCAFSTILWEKQYTRGEDNGEFEYVDFTDDTCVYNDEHDVVDRQCQLIEFEGKVFVCFNVTLGGPETRRTIDIVGTKGRIVGDFKENSILIHRIGRTSPEEIRIQHEKSGHGGGDSVIVRSFMESITNEQYKPEASFKDGLKSALLAFACDRARDEGCVVSVDYLDKVESLRD
jgi:predicted dehydrogenase